MAYRIHKAKATPRKRGRKRDPNSRNQVIMTALFGEEAGKYSSRWATWPEPQRSIYARMFQAGQLIAYADELAQYPSTELSENHNV